MQYKTWLCAPVWKQDLLKKAGEMEADIIHFDLEDSVPESDKAKAREHLLGIFQSAITGVVAVRINELSSKQGLLDLLFLAEHQITPDFLVIPKANIQAHCQLVTDILGPEVTVFAIVEKTTTLHELACLDVKPNNLKGVIFGAADYAQDLSKNPLNMNVASVMDRIAFHASRLQIEAIDSPCFAIYDQEQLQQECERAYDMGFSGKICIHPAQVSTVNQLFSFSQSEIQQAQHLLNAKGKGGIVNQKGQMLGPPFYKYAQGVLDKSTQNS